MIVVYAALKIFELQIFSFALDKLAPVVFYFSKYEGKLAQL